MPETDLKIRPATVEDSALLLEFIRALAEFEKMGENGDSGPSSVIPVGVPVIFSSVNIPHPGAIVNPSMEKPSTLPEVKLVLTSKPASSAEPPEALFTVPPSI